MGACRNCVVGDACVGESTALHGIRGIRVKSVELQFVKYAVVGTTSAIFTGI